MNEVFTLEQAAEAYDLMMRVWQDFELYLEQENKKDSMEINLIF
jgi:hypothetical protein